MLDPPITTPNPPQLQPRSPNHFPGNLRQPGSAVTTAKNSPSNDPKIQAKSQKAKRNNEKTKHSTIPSLFFTDLISNVYFSYQGILTLIRFQKESNVYFSYQGILKPCYASRRYIANKGGLCDPDFFPINTYFL